MSDTEVAAMTSDWPAWVQAIGSVLAIFTAIGLHAYSDWQRRRRLEAVHDALMSRVGDEARACIGEMQRSYTERKNITATAGELDQSIADLRAIGMSADLHKQRLELALELLKVARSISSEVKHWSNISSRHEPVSQLAQEKCVAWASAITAIEKKVIAARR
jgi:hypothetical protein